MPWMRPCSQPSGASLLISSDTPRNVNGALPLLLFMVPVAIAGLNLHQKPRDQQASQFWVKSHNA